MKKISILCLILASIMIFSSLSSCTGDLTENSESESNIVTNTDKNDENDDGNGESTTVATESFFDTEINDSESVIVSTEGTEPEATSPEGTQPEGTQPEETQPETAPQLEGDNAASIQNAAMLANGVQTFYNSDRTVYYVKNKINTIEYALSGKEKLVSSLKNSKGGAYLSDTMDAFVTVTSGTSTKTYYSSTSTGDARINLYRLGYYYYDVHVLDQDFINSTEVLSETAISIDLFNRYKDITAPSFENGCANATITSQVDPQIYANVTYAAEDYNNLQFSFKGDAIGFITVYITAGDSTSHNNKQSYTLNITPSDDYVTYNLPLNSDTIPGYKGNIKSIRFDFGGAVSSSVSLKDVKLQKLKVDSIQLSLDRVFHTFPDKIHQELHFVAYETVNNIDSVGIEYKFPIKSVEKYIVKDAEGLKDDLKLVDWDTAEYIAFDIKDVGVIGIILPYDNQSGSIQARISSGNYLLIQKAIPEGGKIDPPTNSTVNDFRMGHRIYTDETHDFAGFLEAAYCERNPLTSKNVTIDDSRFGRGAKFKGYDALRGVYQFTLKGATSFNAPYYTNQNLHYNASFSIKSDGQDRDIYVMTYTSSGLLECATLLDENNVLLPIPLQVSKNFSEKEEPFYNCGDATYGETFFPLSLKAGEERYYTVLNLYQNWGNYPLKQLSSIGYYMPYYHLSTGVTESNCISPWYNRGKNLWTLPDHRPMSMPKSSDLENKYSAYGNQPQTPNAGYHYFLQYTDSDGNYSASEYLDNEIFAYGPTYADLNMNYLSDDGKIKVSLRHMEMPQTDENRGYYQMTYEVLDTVKINNFRDDFSFYTMTGFSTYKKIGYLNKNNEPKITEPRANTTERAFPLVLGDDCPYFSLFYIPGSENTVYANLSFLILNSEVIIGGAKLEDYNFVALDQNGALSLSLNIPEEVTLVKGDKITINAIIMPWGGGYVLDDGTQYHPMDDINVQNVRLNTLKNPFVATAIENCEAVQSVFLPRVKSTDGKSATFTVSGGCDIDPDNPDCVNVTVRADGFTTLTRIKVEELVGDEWIEYELSSVNNADASGRAADYDGYAVHYDGGDTYGYSFVITITDGMARTFRVIAE